MLLTLEGLQPCTLVSDCSFLIRATEDDSVWLASLMGTNLDYQFLVNLLLSLCVYLCSVGVTLAKQWLCIHGMK